ncbi:MAG: GAF domain-containing protein [Cytophagales bacterium]|nr:GAF domain-containing protein [Bernardetiaceae bacterium]MDW8210100.1 GAF domain-containing protein [Cytophagales bacterium]
MRFFSLSSFKGRINLAFVLVSIFFVVIYVFTLVVTTNLKKQVGQLHLLQSVKNNLKDLEIEFDNARIALLHLLQELPQAEKQSWQERFKRNILNMYHLQKDIAIQLDSLGNLESRLLTDSIGMLIKDLDQQGAQLFEKINLVEISAEQRRTLYQQLYLAEIEERIEPEMLKIIYYNISKNVVDQKRLHTTAIQTEQVVALENVATIVFFAAAVVIGAFWYWITSRINFSILAVYHKLRNILTGKLAKEESEKLNNELNLLDVAADQIREKLLQAVHFISSLKEGKYNVTMEKFSTEDKLASELLQMRDTLQQLAIRDSKRIWVNENTAKFAEMLRETTKTIPEISRDFLHLLTSQVNAQIAGIYLTLQDTSIHQEKMLHLVACYAYGRNKMLQKTIAPGEGLVGQCYLEGETSTLKVTSKHFFTIPAGIGDIEPTSIVYIPIKLSAKILGVLEIASVQPFEEHQIDLMEKVCSLFAATVESIQSFETNKRLLEQSQMLAEDLKAREEEMRQNMEELAATQEEMIRSQAELFRQFEEMEKAKLKAEEDWKAERAQLKKVIEEKERVIREKEKIISQDIETFEKELESERTRLQKIIDEKEKIISEKNRLIKQLTEKN